MHVFQTSNDGQIIIILTMTIIFVFIPFYLKTKIVELYEFHPFFSLSS